MPKIISAWFLALLWPAFCQAQPGEKNWQQETNYTISVTLDDIQQTLNGTLQLEYINHSPDTLQYIWFHLWPNAYKNDKTDFARQQLLTGKLDFYFSKPDQKGYINRLDFSVNGNRASLEDHPQYLDVGKLILPEPLAPGRTAMITTPFHVQLPYRFSRMGYADSFYAVTQWFPKAAVYDDEGWHPMPYLELGEYYADFGTYKVTITLPENYLVAATGVLQTATEKEWLIKKSKDPQPLQEQPAKKSKQPVKKKSAGTKPVPYTRPNNKKLEFLAERVIDFAWFACPKWLVKHEIIQLNNRQVDAWNFVMPGDAAAWQNSLSFTRNAILHYSMEVGEYPYPQVTVVCDPHEIGSGMEYPMITGLNTTGKNEDLLENLILHEVGHNWFQAILANNERDFPWLDEGINTYIENKWMRKVDAYNKAAFAEIGKKYGGTLDQGKLLLSLLTGKKIDQPISTESSKLSPLNYYAIPYTKTATWLEAIENEIGKEPMKEALQQYFHRYAFHHVKPEYLKQTLEKQTGQSMDGWYKKLEQKGNIQAPDETKPIWPINILMGSAPGRNRKVGYAPALGFNEYDKMQVGILAHNFSLPFKPFNWVASPMYATGSGQITGYARGGYSWYPEKGRWQQIEAFASAARFNTNYGNDANMEKVYAGFTKWMPGIYAEQKRKDPLSTRYRWMELKTWIISERTLTATSPPPPDDTIFYNIRGPVNTTLIPQLTLGWNNDRVLYPYQAKATLQQVKDILRISADASYFFNYDATGKGINIRAFAGKIIYLKEKTDEVRIANSRYHFSLYGPNGMDDYTYSIPFMDRNQSVHLAGRQIMERDGFFKYRSDFSTVKPGLSTKELDFFDNWMAVLNFEFDIPDKVNPLSALPFDVPLKLFADVGTSASPWQPNAEHSKFLYSIGLQIPLLKALRIYIPLLDSNDFDEPNSVNDPNKEGGPSWWQKKLTFALNLQPLKPKILNVPLIR